MTTFYLIRHGDNDFIGKAIAGRKSGVHLNEKGRLQSQRIAVRLAGKPITRIFCSPLERCRETASPLADTLNLKIEISETLIEVGYGDWTGKTLDELRPLEAWKTWCSSRSVARIPNGETILEIQARMVAEIQRIHRDFPNESVAVFSHGDPIRALLSYFLGMPLDLLTRLEVSPASINMLTLSEYGVQVLGLNETAD
jgi:broad specificity phosphatase PhoE